MAGWYCLFHTQSMMHTKSFEEEEEGEDQGEEDEEEQNPYHY